jgi:branched-chain amino acid transport system substrate-binding protein
MKFFKLFVAAIFIFNPFQSYAYQTITDASEDAKAKPEFVAMDNDDLMNPSYRNFYKQKQTSWWGTIHKKLTSFWSAKKKESWNQKSFLLLLNEVTEQREQLGLKGSFVHKLVPEDGAKVFLWGDLQGAFHSFTRSLERLQKWGVLDDDFVIKDSKAIVVLHGDLPIRSPYCLETLTLALSLLNKNPKNVFYVRGDIETGGGWNYYSLKQELDLRIGDPLSEKKLERFFETLPLGLYLKNGFGEKSRFARIVHLGKEYKGLDERCYADFLMNDALGLRTHFLSKKRVLSKEKVDVAIKIKGVGRGKVLMYDRGLSLFLTSKEESKWDLLSCPTDVYRKELGLKSDSFVVINIHNDIADWTIHHYSQDFHEKGDLQLRVYDALSGIALQRLTFPWGKEGRLMSDEDLFGRGRVASLKIGIVNNKQNRCASCYAKIAEVNESGGVHGLYLKPMILHGGNDSVASKNQMDELIRKYGIDVYMMLDGTELHEALSTAIARGEILSIFPTNVMKSFLRHHKKVLNWRSFYETEVQVILEHAIRSMQVQKLLFFYEDDVLGRSLMQEVEGYLQSIGMKDYAKIPHAVDSPYMKQYAKRVRAYDPEALFLLTSPSQAMLLLDEVGIDSIATRKLFGISRLADSIFLSFIEDRGLSFISTHAVPDSNDFSDSLIVEYAKTMKGAGLERGTESLEGYVSTNLFVEALRTIEGSLTKEKLLRGIERRMERGYKDLRFFDRRPIHNIWLASNEDEWKHIVAR